MRLGGRKFCAGIFFAAGLAMLASVPAGSGTAPRWPQYGFNARHTLFNPSEKILNPANVTDLSMQWEFMTGNGFGIAPLSGPAVANGVVYVASMAQTTFTALDAATGSSRWVYTGISTFSDPAVGSGHVYTASLDGNLYAFPTDCVGTCTPSWSVPVGTLGTNSPPTWSKGNIYIAGYDGYVYAFNGANGTQLWSALVNTLPFDPLNFAPAVSNDRVFVSGDFGIYAYPASCATPCEPLWIARTQFSPVAAPTVSDGIVMVGDYQGTIYALDAATGGLVWRGAVTASPHSIAAAQGVAYVTSGDEKLVAFAVAGCGQSVCSPLWSSASAGVLMFTPTVANGIVYVGSLDFIYTQGVLVAYPTTCVDGCTPLATFDLDGANETPVAVTGGHIYATTVNGNIDSFGLPP